MKFACLIGFFSMFTSLAAHELLHGGGIANFDEALAAGGVDDVRRFVNPASLNSTGLMGRTPLEMAVWSGNLQVTHYLLDRGANPNVRDTFGLTPLNYAAMRGQLEMTRLLVDRGAEVNLAGADGRTSLSDALACDGSPEVVEWLLDHHADPNKFSYDGWSPLQQAASRGDVRLVRLLLQHGADTHAIDSEGKTAFDEARSEGHWAVTRQLNHWQGRCPRGRTDSLQAVASGRSVAG